MHRAHTTKHDAICGTEVVRKYFFARDLNIDQVLIDKVFPLCSIHRYGSVEYIALPIAQVSMQPTLPMPNHEWHEFLAHGSKV
jgi:hypothetical protein